MKSFLADAIKSKKDNKFYFMPLRIFLSNCFELMGQIPIALNIRYANSIHQFHGLQHKLKL